MSAVAIGAQIGSTLLGSYGMYQASKMTGKTGEYNQKGIRSVLVELDPNSAPTV